jgi:tRNA modification GTPase
MREGLHKIVSVDETIIAIATPVGRSGIGVVRMSGTKVRAIAERFFRPHTANATLEHRSALVGTWVDASGLSIDEVVLTFFRSPQSYTGEDVVEISAHGNPLALRRIVETAISAESRMAEPGEFTLRAVAQGKMDLLQAEAVRDFIEAQTERQAKTAMRQMEGSLSKHLRPIKEKLIDVIARLEAGIDFAEDDVDVPPNDVIGRSIEPIVADLRGIEQTFEYGKMLHRGLQVAILGKPNVGKSSLFNQLIAQDRAIVTDIPGTTRDVLTETVNLDGIPLRFADTAGVRHTTDRVESIGVSRAFETLADADLALVVLDGSASIHEDDRHVLEKTADMRHVIVINKADLPQTLDTAPLNGAPRVFVSAKTGQGVDHLRDTLRAFLMESQPHLADDLVLTDVRHHEAISRSLRSFDAARKALKSQVPHEMVLLDLYAGLSALNELTGEVVTEDILDRIFSTFCIGK